jgi:hypothetical protein
VAREAVYHNRVYLPTVSSKLLVGDGYDRETTLNKFLRLCQGKYSPSFSTEVRLSRGLSLRLQTGREYTYIHNIYSQQLSTTFLTGR